jgi:hypothetical protein
MMCTKFHIAKSLLTILWCPFPQAIEKELLERLKAGTYGDIPNVPWRNYERVLDMEEEKGEVQEEEEDEDEDEDEEVRVWSLGFGVFQIAGRYVPDV